MKNKLFNNSLETDEIQAHCIICNTSHVHKEFAQPGLRKDFKAIICPMTGFRSVYPPPVNISSGDSYKNSTGVSVRNNRSIKALLRIMWISLRIKPVETMLLNRLSGGNILDIGAGDGTLLQSIRSKSKNDFSITALEVSDADFSYLKSKGINVLQSTLEDAAFPDNSFDAVMATHVFEHIPDLVKLMTEIKNVLKPGGLLIASVPSESSLSMRLGLKASWKELGVQGHVYSFNRASLPKFFTNYDFDVIAAEESLVVPQITVAGTNRKKERGG